MDCAELQGGLFSDCQEWHVQAAKRSDKSSTILQIHGFADAQESRFQGSKRSNGGCAALLGFRSGDVQEFCFRTEKL